MNKIELEKDIKVSARFSRGQLAGSERYRNRRDVLNVVLDENTAYSFDEADRLIEKFMKGKVK